MFGSVFCGEFEKCQCLGWLLQHPRVACDVICKLAYDKPPHALECSRWQKSSFVQKQSSVEIWSELLSVILIMEIKGLFILFIYYFFTIIPLLRAVIQVCSLQRRGREGRHTIF